MPQASADLQNAKADAKAAVENLSDYTYAQKEAFVQKMRDNLADLKKEIDDLGTKISQSTDEVKAAAKPKLEALDDQFDKLKAKLDNAEDATEDTWDNIKVGIKQSYDDLKKAYGDATQTTGTPSTPNQT
jgi:archaellum component FlaC